jgi:hypothetical protein
MNEEAKKDYIHKYTKLHASVTEKGKKVAALQAEVNNFPEFRMLCF